MTPEEITKMCQDMAEHCYDQQIEPILDKQSDLLRAVSNEGGAQVMLATYLAASVIANAYAMALTYAKPGKHDEVAGMVSTMLLRATMAGHQSVRENAHAL